MKPKKIMVIFGTRPEATKMGTVVQELKKYPEWFEVRLIVTGQHKEQLYQALDNFNLTPDIDLGLMKTNQSLVYVTTAATNGLNDIVEKEKPDFILVHGDTQTSFAGALVAFLHKIPVGHVEAGLRSYNKFSPYPEEVNRRLTDVLADFLFAPTQLSCDNLIKEGYRREQIFITGQTAVDATMMAYKENYRFSLDALNHIAFNQYKIITMTAHRRENYGEPMRQMFTAIRRIVEDNPEALVIYPVHLSPIVREAAYGILSHHERILLLEPIEFLDLINLQAKSYMILSDSGGLQEEAVVFHKPMVLMRDTTERPEAIEAGSVYLAGTGEESIYAVASRLLKDEVFYHKLSNTINPFGDGRASERIVQILAHYFGFIGQLPEEFLGR